MTQQDDLTLKCPICGRLWTSPALVCPLDGAPLSEGLKSGSLPEIDSRYKLLAAIGSGARGRVYKAQDLLMEREVAIKVLRMSLASDPRSLERFTAKPSVASKQPGKRSCS